MSELKPCPFCGGEMKTDVVTFDVEFYEPPYEQWYLEHIDLDTAADEHCPIPTTDTFYETEAEAIEAWNTRVETVTVVTGITTVTDTPQITYVPERTCYNTHENRWFKCSACGYGFTDLYADDEHDINEQPYYCPNCGARMVSE